MREQGRSLVSPTRRALLALGVPLVAIVFAIAMVARLQLRQLGDSLVSDVHSTLTRTIEREPSVDLPAHQNGFACFDATMIAAPDLAPFGSADLEIFGAMLDAGVVPERWRANVASLEPWAHSLRGCGNSAQLAYVGQVTPFVPAYRGRGQTDQEAMLALIRLTRFQAQSLAASEQWSALAILCADSLELVADRSHTSAMAAAVCVVHVEDLAPACGEALSHLSVEERPALAARFARIPARFAENSELVELERQAISLEQFGWLLTDAQQQQLSMARPVPWAPEGLLNRLGNARRWARYDRAMRGLVRLADAPGPARFDAAVAAQLGAWGQPVHVSPSPDGFEGILFAKADDGRLLLQLLAGLSAGDGRALPPRTRRFAGGLEFTNHKGEKVVIAVATSETSDPASR